MASSSFSSRSWEGWAPRSEPSSSARTSWAECEDDDALDYANVPADVAGEELYSLLLQLKLTGALSARQTCVLAFWATKAGATGPSSTLALRPDAASGKFSKRSDDAVGTYPRDADHYVVDLGRRLRQDATRRWDPIPTMPPHQALAAEFEQHHGELTQELQRAKDNHELPPRYLQHPAVATAPAGVAVHPASLYMDAVQYHRLDSVLGLWAYFALSGRRHLVAVLRRSEMCSCGCRGWDSIRPLLSMVAWSLASMLRGQHPTGRHDGEPWKESDEVRASMAGTPLGFRALCLFVKGDWCEYSHTLGLPAWNDGVSPCPLCFATQETFYDTNRLSVFSAGHHQKTHRHYEQSCQACELRVQVKGPSEHLALKSAVFFDKRPAGNRGLCLNSHLEALGLLKGDRLEPCAQLANVAAFGEATTPCELLFWRTSKDTAARRRCPLFSEETGVDVGSLGVDWMHSISLGVMQHLLAHLVWSLITANVWNIPGPTQNVLELSVARLRAELFAWYGAGGKGYTRVQQLLPSMLGTSDAKALKLHASETNGFLAFSKELLDRYGEALQEARRPYTVAVDSLLRIVQSIARYPRAYPAAAMQAFVDDGCLHLQSIRELGVGVQTKHHMLLEHAGRLPCPRCARAGMFSAYPLQVEAIRFLWPG